MKKITFIITILTAITLLQFGVSYPQWQPDVRLTNDTGYSGSTRNAIASQGNTLHVVWYDDRDGNYEIYYKRSTNGGLNWSPDYQMTNDSGESYNPVIANSGSVIHILWYDNRNGFNNNNIYYKRSTNGGSSWEPDVRLTNVPSSWDPFVQVSGLSVYTVWYDGRNGNYEIYFKRSTNNGETWEPEVRLTNNSARSEFPTLAVSNSTIYVTWYDSRDGNDEIYYKRSTDLGSTWGNDTRLTFAALGSNYPFITVLDQKVNIVWFDYRSTIFPNIYFKTSTNGGLTWSTDLKLTYSNQAYYPSMIAADSLYQVVWRDSRDGNTEIYMKRSADGGVSWGPDTRLTNDTSQSQVPSLTAIGQGTHLIWFDRRDNNYEIYYKKNPTGNLVGIYKSNSEIPTEYFLSQNYPNPFNPVTKITFTLPISPNGNGSMVKLTIYDILGREVATLVNEQLNHGTYEAEWDAENYPSGVYYYKLSAGDYSDTKKMILIK